MIHPVGEVEQVLKPQLALIARNIYGKKTENVIFRVKKLQKYANRRKLFFPGNGEVVDLELFPHITLSQKIEIDEDQEYILESKIKKLAVFTPFEMRSNSVGDYGEDFTIYLAFELGKEVDKLRDLITAEFGEYFPRDQEIRDTPHITLVYDDSDVDNFRRAWTVVDKNKLLGKKMLVNSVWLWKGMVPYKEFKFRS